MKRLLNEYANSLKSIELEEVLDLIIYRPLAFIFVKQIATTKVTPNQITMVSMLVGIAGGINVYFDTPLHYSFAALLFFMFTVLDCSDGQLARINKNGTHLGRILDGIADYIVSIAVYLGIGFGFAANSSDPTLMWLFVIATGLSNAFQAILVDFHRARYLDAKLDRISVLDDELESFKEELEKLRESNGSKIEMAIIAAYIKYSALQKRMSGKKQKEKEQPRYDNKDYYNKNKILIHFWSYIGTSAQWSFLVITLWINRLDIYMIGICAVGNLLAMILLLVQKRQDSKLKMQGAL